MPKTSVVISLISIITVRRETLRKTIFSLFSQLARDAVDQFVPDKVRVSSRKPWEDSDIEGARRALVIAKLRFHQNRTDENRLKSSRGAKILSDLYVLKENEWLTSIIENLMKLSGDHQYKEVWNQINFISGRKARVSATINANSDEERVKLWVEHFRKLLSPTVKITGKRVVHAPVLPDIAKASIRRTLLESQQSAQQPISDLLFWSVPNGVNKRGNYKTYVHILLQDYTGEQKKVVKKEYAGAVQQVKSAMEDRGQWRRETQKSTEELKRARTRKDRK